MGFSFGSGNVAKLVRIPLYVLGRLATLVIPRSRDEWVFGCAAGVTDGALVLWRRAEQDGRRMLWLTATPADAAAADALGIPHVPKHSVQGFWRTARARVIVVTHGQGDANRYAVGGSFLVQLWHGIPLKRLGLDSAETLRTGVLPDIAPVRAALRLAYRRTQAAIRLLPAASAPIADRLRTAFGLGHERVRVTGEPRVDVLSLGTPEERRRDARRLVAERALPRASEVEVDGVSRDGADLGEASTRLVLYAPTWRDGDPDPGVPSVAEWRSIGALLDRHDAVLVIRSHPLGQGEYAPPAEAARISMLPSSRLADVTPALPAFDALVTDYSSLGYDVGLIAMPVVWFAPDEAAYEARRGFYGAYADVAPAPTRTWEETLAVLNAVLGDDAERARLSETSRALSERVHAYRDGRNVERVYRLIVEGARLDRR